MNLQRIDSFISSSIIILYNKSDIYLSIFKKLTYLISLTHLSKYLTTSHREIYYDDILFIIKKIPQVIQLLPMKT